MTSDTSKGSVTDYLSSDHRRLDGLMQSCRELVEKGVMNEAAGVFAEFRAGLKRHVKIEEGLVFPVFESSTGLTRSAGPTGVMRHEHEEILRLLDLIKDLFESASPTPSEFSSLRSALAALLQAHNDKEERILYPMTDRAASPEALRELVEKMKAFK
jgi:iron-sulfur cluster repair protein YtfE (RIC family)